MQHTPALLTALCKHLKVKYLQRGSLLMTKVSQRWTNIQNVILSPLLKTQPCLVSTAKKLKLDWFQAWLHWEAFCDFHTSLWWQFFFLKLQLPYSYTPPTILHSYTCILFYATQTFQSTIRS